MKYRYIYGPVPSWRLGRSLGVDPVYTGRGKICSFNCIYCQVGKTKTLTNKRKVFVKTEKIIEEMKSLPRVQIDYVTMSGAGEPTLAKNLGEIIKEIKKMKIGKTAVLTNSSLIDRKDVCEDLRRADFVVAKLDAHIEDIFKRINKPAKSVKLDNIIRGIKEFRRSYKGKFALQIMFTGENKPYAEEIAHLAKEINPDEIQINTPLRPCGVRPISKKEMAKIKEFFKGVNYISIYEAKRKKVKPISKPDTLKRRGKI